MQQAILEEVASMTVAAQTSTIQPAAYIIEIIDLPTGCWRQKKASHNDICGGHICQGDL